MTSLTEKITKLLKEKGLNDATIASDEGLPIVSTFKKEDAESIAASGVYDIHQKLSNPDMSFLTIFDRDGLKFLYTDGEFHYIIKSKNPITEDIIQTLRELLDNEVKEREEMEEKREEEIKKKNAEREKRLDEVKKEKEERRKRLDEVKKEKEERRKRLDEVKKEKEERRKRLDEVKKEKEERRKRLDEVKKEKEERRKRLKEVKKEKEERRKRLEEIKKVRGGGEKVMKG